MPEKNNHLFRTCKSNYGKPDLGSETLGSGRVLLRQLILLITMWVGLSGMGTTSLFGMKDGFLVKGDLGN